MFPTSNVRRESTAPLTANGSRRQSVWEEPEEPTSPGYVEPPPITYTVEYTNQVMRAGKSPLIQVVPNYIPPAPAPIVPRKLTRKEKVKKFFKKYFLEGQKLDESYLKQVAELRPDAPWQQRAMVKHRRLIGFLIPIVFFETLWWVLAIRWDYFSLYPTHYIMPITMAFGSTIGGATSEGSGSIAFPVMTLALGLHASVARDFSLMIQSFGMTSACFCILWMKLKLEWYSILFTNVGGIFGMIFGLEVIDPLLGASERKLGFVSTWFAFALSLAILNRHKRRTFDAIPDFNWWRGIVLVLIGFLGGIMSSLTGVGLDIASFSILCLLFRVSEKVATPTSIVLQATNTLTGFFWRQLMTSTGAESLAWQYLTVTVPVSVIAGPFGAYLSSFCHRQVFAFFVYIGDTIALITAYCVLPMTWQLGVMSVSMMLGCFLIFLTLTKFGSALLASQEEKERQRIHDDLNNISNSNSSDVVADLAKQHGIGGRRWIDQNLIFGAGHV